MVSTKYVIDQAYIYIQENKVYLYIFVRGDWVLRVY